MNKRNWRISSLCIVFLVCLGLAFVVTPVLNRADACLNNVNAVNIGATDALAKLDSQIVALPDSAFKKPNYRDALRHMIDAVIEQAEDGAYHGAIRKLYDIEYKISKWIVEANQSSLLEGVEVAIVAISNASETTVPTWYGKVAGADAGNDSWAWKGVPYAKPPLGALRWKAPQNPHPWHGIRHSTDKFDVATQPLMSLLWLPGNQVIGSEDCLYVNVYRPKKCAWNLPVFVWIHGGANYFGGAPSYDGSILASQANMIVVVIQYRLGPLGWLYFPALNPQGTAEDKSGNYGTLDTLKAVKWVRENIRAFGGNPYDITVGGQSAGGLNTLNLLVSPLAKGLFQRAFVMSAGGADIPASVGLSQANAIIDKLLAADGKTRDGMTDAEIAAYLRGKNAIDVERAVMESNGSIALGAIEPFTDGVVIPGTFADMMSAGKYNKMPIILGSTAYETKPFLPLYVWPSVFYYLAGAIPFSQVFASPNLPSFVYEACGYYPGLAWKASMVDSLARSIKQYQDDVYCFQFKWGGTNSTSDPLAFLYGAGHATDIAFFFGQDHDVYGLTLFNSNNQQGRVALQQAMMSYLAKFAAKGNPNAAGSGLTVWEKWSNDAGAPKSIIFDATLTQTNISMMNVEVTKAGVIAQIDALPYPDSLKNLIKNFIFF